MSRAEEFIDKYKRFEDICRRSYSIPYNKSIPMELRAKRKLLQFESEISYCQDVRNLLQHKYKIASDYCVEPSIAMLKLVDRLIEAVQNRQKCMQIAVPERSIYARKTSDSVLETMKVMQTRNFSAVPILKDGIAVGVFNENSLFSYLCDTGKAIVSEDDTFEGSLQKYIGLEREGETCCFIGRNTYVDDLLDLYEEKEASGRRLSVVFITNNGRENEKIAGMLTPWDILNGLS